MYNSLHANMEHLSESTLLSRYSKEILKTTSTLNCSAKLLQPYDNNFTCVRVLHYLSTKITEVLKEEGFRVKSLVDSASFSWLDLVFLASDSSITFFVSWELFSMYNLLILSHKYASLGWVKKNKSAWIFSATYFSHYFCSCKLPKKISAQSELI